MLSNGNDPLNALLVCIQHRTTDGWQSRKERDQLPDIFLIIVVQIRLGNISYISYNHIELLGMRICVETSERCDGFQNKCIPQVVLEEGNEDLHDSLDVWCEKVCHPPPNTVKHEGSDGSDDFIACLT